MQQPVGVAGGGLERMAERMSEVQERTLSRFALVPADDRGLVPAARCDCFRAGAAARKNLVTFLFEPREERRVGNQPVLHDLRIASAELPLRQGIQQAGVGKDECRLMECADKIFAVTRVDAGLAAHRRIDLRQQRCRNLHKVDATPGDGGSEAGEIPDDTAAKSDYEITALDLRIEDGVDDCFECAVVL